MKTALVTGGTGYIGSHCIVQLLNEGYAVITIDNGINSRTAVLTRIEAITGAKVTFCWCDLCDKITLGKVFDQFIIDIVVHCAGYKYIAESISNPMEYYRNNLISTINLLEVMKENNVFQLVFSSSCAVYGDPETLPINESHPIGKTITNTYGRTKYFIEQILIDISKSDERWNIISLRYFNPIGAHPSGNIGEDNIRDHTNILPLVAKVAAGMIDNIKIFGSDYNTPDGSPIRDYIHVMDLADGHVLAVNKLKQTHLKYKVYNLGLGKGVTVLDLVKEYEKASGKKVNYEITNRREGDVECLICDVSLASKELGWLPKRGLEEMCKDFHRWQCQNPLGYSELSEFRSYM